MHDLAVPGQEALGRTVGSGRRRTRKEIADETRVVAKTTIHPIRANDMPSRPKPGDQPGPLQLRRIVEPASGLAVHRGRRQQPEFVVGPQRLRREPRDLRERPDRQQSHHFSPPQPVPMSLPLHPRERSTTAFCPDILRNQNKVFSSTGKIP
ncbi:hypothetical protein GCM10020219_017700 [Nonomuraea dietziae]